MADVDIGYWFQDKVGDELRNLEGTNHIRTIRLYDSRSARGRMLPNQPGDFLVAHSGRVLLLECKASRKHESLRNCLSSHVPNEQIAQHRMWLRSGNPACFMFYSVINKRIEIWPSEIVIQARLDSKPLPLGNGHKVAESSITQLPALLRTITLGDLL